MWLCLPCWEESILALLLLFPYNCDFKTGGFALRCAALLQYSEIWDIDAKDPLTGPEGGESAADVARRTANTIATIDKEVQGYAPQMLSA